MMMPPLPFRHSEVLLRTLYRSVYVCLKPAIWSKACMVLNCTNTETAHPNFPKGTVMCPHFAAISSAYVEVLMTDQFLVQEVTLNV
jgi:hypothetical protein